MDASKSIQQQVKPDDTNNLKRSQSEASLGNVGEPVNIVENTSSPSPTTTKKKKKRRSHTRTMKACESCRKQKTRCFKSPNTIGCLRCLSLGVSCSFEDDFNAGPTESLVGISSLNTLHSIIGSGSSTTATPIGLGDPTVSPQQGTDMTNREKNPVDVKDKLMQISTDLQNVIKNMALSNAINNTAISSSSVSTLPIPNVPDPVLKAEALKINMTSNTNNAITKSPLQQLYEASSNCSIPTVSLGNQIDVVPEHDEYEPSIRYQSDLITLNILTEEQACKLLNIFRERYGRWLLFPDNIDSVKLLTRIRTKGPLLLTIACCLSLKYADPYLKQQTYLTIMQVLKKDLEVCLLMFPKTLEFIQSLIILSLYSSNLSSDFPELKLDSYQLSTLGIQLFLNLNQIGFDNYLYTQNQVAQEVNELTVFRLWNNLVLTHLCYCILTGKQSIFSLHLLKPKRFPKLSISTNFDFRIIAEIEMFTICYTKLVLNFEMSVIKIDLTDWLKTWSILFNKSSNQFVEIDYHFTELLIILSNNDLQLDTSVKEPTQRMDNEVFKVVYFHVFKILSLINSVKDDSYFAFLSDQIHLMVVHTSTVGIKLLNLNNYLKIKDQTQVNDCFKLLFKLINRFKRLATHESDSFAVYSDLLEQNLLLRFADINPDDYIMEDEQEVVSGSGAGADELSDDDENEEDGVVFHAMYDHIYGSNLGLEE
ncbi:unnamed protein product [Ambrosiozyma monospora]|uniref:Unnamed protein product n=1 Tax=Ambrosiozyma monospora TaxID=43982 RepID=A0A9W6YT37_AMBMO|nr:unnamed protein product [Ambrosiozyma monospora]